MKKLLSNIAFPFILLYALLLGTFEYFKPKWKDFVTDLKYDRELRKMYRRANARIKEATMRCRSEGRQFYVLPDPNKRGDFYCISPRERDLLVKQSFVSNRMDGVFLIKNSIFIARPSGKHERREIKASKEWLLGKK